jgi:DNA-binding response OmpR family regulator
LPHDPGILIVDDDPTILHLLGVALPMQGFHVWTARSQEAALRLADSLQGRLVVALVDLSLGAENGLRVLQALRVRLPGVPLCLMSGALTREEGDSLRNQGADRVFPKPFRLPELARDLREAAGLGPREWPSPGSVAGAARSRRTDEAGC